MVNLDICKNCQHYKKKKENSFTLHTCALETMWYTFPNDNKEDDYAYGLAVSYGNFVLRMEKKCRILQERPHPKECPYALEHLV